MYQAIYYSYKNRKVHLRDSKIGWNSFDYYPTYYKICKDGEYETLDGLRATPVNKCDKTKPLEYYEIDIPMETRVLIDLYKESDEVPEWQNIVFFDIEIEIGGALTPEYIKAAPMPVTSIALFDQTTKSKICYIIDKEGKLDKVERDGTLIIPCKSEKELLKLFLDKWEELDPTIITGWNSGYFDIPYMYYRLCNLFGEDEALRLSPLKEIKFNEYDLEQPVVIAGINHLDYMLLFKKFITKQEPSYKLGDIGEKYVKLGKIDYEGGNLDKLFREDIDKFIEYNIRDVDILIKLDKKMQFIILAVLICHLCHVPYEQIYYSTVMNEGAILTYLKRKDIVSPNKPTTINPSLKENLGPIKKDFKKLKTKLKKLTLQNILTYPDFKAGLRSFGLHSEIEETIIKVYTQKNDLVFQLLFEGDELVIEYADEYAGGYLKDPIPGLYEWVSDLDFTSLYPSIIRNLNMGLETLVGRVQNRGKYDNQWGLGDLKKLDSKQELVIEKVSKQRIIKQSTIKVDNLIELIEENNLSISANGTLFRTDKTSIVVEILNDWFTKRKEFNTLKKKYGKEGNKELEEFYDKRQHAFKIKLNDLYGCYAINGWRYSDGNKFISKAITLTGQRLDQDSIIFVNEEINKELGTNKDYVVTADTDSLFFQMKDIIKHRSPETDITSREQVIPIALEITKEYQEKTKPFLQNLSKTLFNCDNIYFELKQEVILERGYFAGKRRYAQYIVNREGYATEELDMKGLDIMKSNMVPLYKNFGKEILMDIMYGKKKSEIDVKIVDFRKYLKTLTYKQMAKPTGVKKIKEYIASSPGKGEIFSKLGNKCPINTKACIYYNDIVRHHKLDKQYTCFTEGDKMYYINLKQNPYKIDVLGFNGVNDPPFIIDYLKKLTYILIK